jgi:hypothetical protein
MLGVQRRAALGAERRRGVRVRAGTLPTLWVLRAARSCRAGGVRASCMVGLGHRRLGELILGVDARLAAR